MTNETTKQQPMTKTYTETPASELVKPLYPRIIKREGLPDDLPIENINVGKIRSSDFVQVIYDGKPWWASYRYDYNLWQCVDDEASTKDQHLFTHWFSTEPAQVSGMEDLLMKIEDQLLKVMNGVYSVERALFNITDYITEFSQQQQQQGSEVKVTKPIHDQDILAMIDYYMNDRLENEGVSMRGLMLNCFKALLSKHTTTKQD